MVEEQLDQCRLQTSFGGVRTGNEQVHRRLVGSTTIGVGQRIDLRPRVNQSPRDGSSIRRRFLAEILDPVGGDVVQQRRAMLPRRMVVHESGIPRQEVVQRRDISCDHRVSGSLELARG